MRLLILIPDFLSLSQFPFVVELGEAQHLVTFQSQLRYIDVHWCRTVYNCNYRIVTPFVLTCGVKPAN